MSDEEQPAGMFEIDGSQHVVYAGGHAWLQSDTVVTVEP